MLGRAASFPGSKTSSRARERQRQRYKNKKKSIAVGCRPTIMPRWLPASRQAAPFSSFSRRFDAFLVSSFRLLLVAPGQVWSAEAQHVRGVRQGGRWRGAGGAHLSLYGRRTGMYVLLLCSIGEQRATDTPSRKVPMSTRLQPRRRCLGRTPSFRLSISDVCIQPSIYIVPLSLQGPEFSRFGGVSGRLSRKYPNNAGSV